MRITMYTVTMDHKHGGTDEKHFRTELGAFDHTRNMILENTSITRNLATDITNILFSREFKVKQKRLGPLLITIARA